MSESGGTNMICPKCGQFQEKADICTACGVVIAKFRTEPNAATTENSSPEGVRPVRDVSPETSTAPGSYKKLIMPMMILGVILIGVGASMLINKLSGGSLNEGTMRHLGWFLIPVFIMTGIGCIGQALEWKKIIKIR